mgnify:CR=1 FL=1
MAENLLKMMKEKDVEFVDLRFTDIQKKKDIEESSEVCHHARELMVSSEA